MTGVSLSIVIPAYNEAERLPATLARVQAYLAGRHDTFQEVLVVDDGSRDATPRVVEDFARRHPAFRLLSNPGNRGKGYAVRNGMLAARGGWRLFSDADLSAPIEELDTLLAAAERERADVVIGSRAVDRALVGVHQPFLREYSGRLFNLVMRLVTGLPFRDTQCGFKLYSAAAAEAVFPRQLMDGFSFDVEDLVIARRLGLKVYECGVRWDNVEGSKVTLARGLSSFADLFRIRARAARGLYR
jgi:glycosyltransferase involved in cell wall biosynthesis